MEWSGARNEAELGVERSWSGAELEWSGTRVEWDASGAGGFGQAREEAVPLDGVHSMC